MNVIADSGTGRARRLAAVTALLLLAGLLCASSTRANELAYRGCITGDPALGPSGSGACVEIDNAGLNPVLAFALSPDGSSLYTAGYVDGATYAIARFDRDPATGALAYRGCIADHKASAGTCEVIPGASKTDPVAPLYGVQDLTASPDGSSVYAVGYYSVVRFDRNPATGALTYRGCITGATRSGVHSCDEIPSASVDGYGSGMDIPSDVAVSSDGKSLYVASPITVPNLSGNAAVARFDRDPGSGALTWRGCISGSTALGPAGTGACALIPSASSDALDSGLNPESLSLSPDGKSLYTGSSRGCGDQETGCVGSQGLARFDRDPTTGALTYRGCITGDKRSGPSGSGACAAIPSATKDGIGSGLRGYALAESPDGRSLYVGGGSDVARLGRDPATGALTYRDCITGNRQSGPSGSGACVAIRSATKDGRHSGLSGRALAASPDGKTLYAGGGSEVARLARDPDTGAVKFHDCVTGDKQNGPSGSGACGLIPSADKRGGRSGLGGVTALAPSQDGESLYSASGWGSAGSVARFGFASQTRITKGRTRRHRAVFHFRAGMRSSFDCKLKGKWVRPRLRHWRHCGSKALSHRGAVRYRKLRHGRKVFRVRATDTAGNTDPTPAKRRWRVR